MTFAVGSLVSARGREWVVLPETQAENDILVLRPLGGTDEEVTGIYVGKNADGTPFERVESAEIPLPSPGADLGNHLSCGLLRDAVRLGFRSAAGPFRSLARIAVEPRPYQLVPLLLALRQDPVRLLIADDVGIGKTVEACLIARELLDRGEIRRFAVLCPPHLAEQWQKALREQFHLTDTVLILSGTAARLERESNGVPLFDRHRVTVISTDYIKQERRRAELLRACPELVIVDEAHTCAESGGRGASQQRYAMLREIAKDPSRHLVLVTATPHSGKPETFRSLLALLKSEFGDLPEDLSGEVNRKHREHLAEHLVQRRRGDIKAYQDIVTPFPTRETAEATYSFQPAYRAFMKRLAGYCNESVQQAGTDKRRKRIQWWSALALLRAFSSSPAAAASTLRNRSATADAETVEAVDEEGKRAVLDLDDESAEGLDAVPGAGEDSEESSAERRKLLELAREAEKLAGKEDAKLTRITEIVAGLVAEGRAPILFCRFIPTVDYVADALRAKLPKEVSVEAVTGLLPPEERESRVEALSKRERRVLVCTDCLSEGINLQHAFDTVVHYDLAWNPTRHEQREGRVDRYGQPVPVVRTLTYYGRDNAVDGVVLNTLVRKHKNIRDQLGIAVPIPMDTEAIEEAMQGILQLKDPTAPEQLTLDLYGPKIKTFDLLWDQAVEREKKSRALFAHTALEKAVNEEIFRELAEVRVAIGNDADVERFTLTGLRALKAVVPGAGPFDIDVRECPLAVQDAIGEETGLRVVFRGQPRDEVILLTRAHPVVEGLSSYVLQTALDAKIEGPAQRAGVVRTSGVSKRTTVILARFRFHLVGKDREGREQKLLAEDLVLAGFQGSPDAAEWLAPAAVETVLATQPSGNIPPDLAREQLQAILDRFDVVRPHLLSVAKQRGAALLDAHKRVRKIVKTAQRTTGIDAHEAADVIGVFVYLPDGTGGPTSGKTSQPADKTPGGAK